MSRREKSNESNLLPTLSSRVNHQVSSQLSAAEAATLAVPTTAILAASQRVRVTLWVQASW